MYKYILYTHQQRLEPSLNRRSPSAIWKCASENPNGTGRRAPRIPGNLTRPSRLPAPGKGRLGPLPSPLPLFRPVLPYGKGLRDQRWGRGRGGVPLARAATTLSAKKIQTRNGPFRARAEVKMGQRLLGRTNEGTLEPEPVAAGDRPALGSSRPAGTAWRDGPPH